MTLPSLSLQSGSAKRKSHSSDKRYGGSSSPWLQSGKIALRLSFPDEGIAVNSWNVLVKINNTGAALGVPLHFKSHSFFLLFFNLSQAGRSENSKHCGGWLAGRVWAEGKSE